MAAKKNDRKDAFKMELKRQFRLTMPLKDLDLVFNKAEGYFYNLFSGDAQIAVPFILEARKKVPLSLFALTRAGLWDPFENPADILMSQREQRLLPANPFLDGLAPRILVLLGSEVSRHVSAASEYPVLEALEEQRYTDRALAQETCEKLIFKIVETLEELPAPRPRKLVGELAASFSLWATIQRGRGFRDLAVKTFLLAFPLAQHSRDPWALGVCYQRASYLLGDLDRNDLGYEFTRDALMFLSGDGGSVNLWKCHTDRGHFLIGLGKLEDAQEAFEQAIELLPGSEWRNHVAALQGLSVIERKRGRPDKAREYLVSAAVKCQQEDLVLGHVKWSRAVVEFRLGQVALSRSCFEEATELLARFGSAGDVALICVDHVEVLLLQKEPRRAAVIIAQVAAWLPQLRANPILCRSFGHFLDLARTARIELAELPQIREDLKKAWKQGETP